MKVEHKLHKQIVSTKVGQNTQKMDEKKHKQGRKNKCWTKNQKVGHKILTEN